MSWFDDVREEHLATGVYRYPTGCIRLRMGDFLVSAGYGVGHEIKTVREARQRAYEKMRMKVNG